MSIQYRIESTRTRVVLSSYIHFVVVIVAAVFCAVNIFFRCFASPININVALGQRRNGKCGKDESNLKHSQEKIDRESKIAEKRTLGK